MTGMRWLRIGEQYMTAAFKLSDRVTGLSRDDWDGTDRLGFDMHAGRVGTQLSSLAAFAFEVGASLVAIGGLLTSVVVSMAAAAGTLMALAVSYWAVKFIPYVGKAASDAIAAAAKVVAKFAVTVLTFLEKIVESTGRFLGEAIKLGMATTGALQTVSGNWINPLKVAGPAVTSFAEGYLQKILVEHFAPAGGRHGQRGWEHWGMGVQGLYNLGMGVDGMQDNGDGGWATDVKDGTGLNPGNLDFVPLPEADNGFLYDKPEGVMAPEDPPSWT